MERMQTPARLTNCKFLPTHRNSTSLVHTLLGPRGDIHILSDQAEIGNIPEPEVAPAGDAGGEMATGWTGGAEAVDGPKYPIRGVQQIPKYIRTVSKETLISVRLVTTTVLLGKLRLRLSFLVTSKCL